MDYGLIVGGEFDPKYIFGSVKEAREKAVKLIWSNVNVTAVVGVKNGKPYYTGHTMQFLDVVKRTQYSMIISCDVWSANKKRYITYNLNADGSLDMKGTRKKKDTDMHPFGL